jgi:hypothetical protein
MSKLGDINLSEYLGDGDEEESNEEDDDDDHIDSKNILGGLGSLGMKHKPNPSSNMAGLGGGLGSLGMKHKPNPPSNIAGLGGLSVKPPKKFEISGLGGIGGLGVSTIAKPKSKPGPSDLGGQVQQKQTATVPFDMSGLQNTLKDISDTNREFIKMLNVIIKQNADNNKANINAITTLISELSNAFNNIVEARDKKNKNDDIQLQQVQERLDELATNIDNGLTFGGNKILIISHDEYDVKNRKLDKKRLHEILSDDDELYLFGGIKDMLENIKEIFGSETGANEDE